MGFESKLLGIKSDVVETTLANLGSAQNTGSGAERLIKETKAIIKSNGTAFLGVIYRNNTPISSANHVSGSMNSPIVAFDIPSGAMDRDSSLIMKMTARIFDTVSASRIFRVYANTTQIATVTVTSTSGIFAFEFIWSNAGDSNSQLFIGGNIVAGTENTTISSSQIDTTKLVTISIVPESATGFIIKHAFCAELK